MYASKESQIWSAGAHKNIIIVTENWAACIFVVIFTV